MTVTSYHPSSRPISSEKLDIIKRAHDAGVLDDAEMLACQDQLFDPCIDHPDRPGKFEVYGYLRCVECAVALHRAARA